MKKFEYRSVIGHDLVCDKLRQSVIANKTVSAYLFSGSPGIGKKTLAAPFAAGLLCHNPIEGGACLACPSCRLLLADAHPDLIRIAVPEGKKTISVETVREQVLKEAYVRPFSAQRKVFIIEDGECMTVEAQNALLKVLEEPPSYVVFLILTSAQNQLLETVRSRCLKLELLPLKAKVCSDYFAQQPEGDPKRRQLAAAYAQGNLGRGRKMLLNQEFYELYDKTLTQVIIFLQRPDGLVDMQQFLTEHRDSIEDIIDFMLIFFRDCLRQTVSKSAPFICVDRVNAVLSCKAKFTAGGLVHSMEALIRFRNRLQNNAGFTVACLELLTNIQEEIHD